MALPGIPKGDNIVLNVADPKKFASDMLGYCFDTNWYPNYSASKTPEKAIGVAKSPPKKKGK